MQKLKSIFANYKYLSFNIQKIIIAVVFFYLGFFFFVIVFSYDKFFMSIIQSLATLSAAFFGAWFAFSLQSQSKKKEEISKQVSVGNRAIFTLIQRINNLKVYQKEFIDPYNRKHPGIFIFIRPTKDFEKDDTLFDMNSLDFLIYSDNPQLLMDLYIEDQRYKTAIRCINFHAKLHDQVQPLLEKAEFKEGQDYNIDFFKNALGSHLFFTLTRTVEDLITNVDKTIETSMDVKNKLRKCLKSKFPDKGFLNIELIENKRDASI